MGKFKMPSLSIQKPCSYSKNVKEVGSCGQKLMGFGPVDLVRPDVTRDVS